MKSYGCCDHLEGFWKNLRSKINQVWAKFCVSFLSEHPVLSFWWKNHIEHQFLQVGNLQKKFGQNHLRSKCGLPLATYFSATKLSWLLENVEDVKAAAENGTLMFGTVDTWLVWNLTGQGLILIIKCSQN